MIRSTLAADRYVAGENDVVLGGIKTAMADQPFAAIWCHGSGEVAFDTPLRHRFQFRSIGLHATVHAGDLGFQTFGNDLVVTRIGQAISYLRASWGSEGKVALIGQSMGACSALNYALRFPENVACVAGVIPMLDIQGIIDNPASAGFKPQIDAAYGGTYNNATDGPTHSPVLFAGDMDPDLPIKLWTASNDPWALPAHAEAFVAARPQTEHVNVGALGHTDTAVDAITDQLTAFTMLGLASAAL